VLFRSLEEPLHRGVQNLIRDLNAFYDEENALWEVDSDPAGFEWIDVNNASENNVAFLRRSSSTGRELICVCNFSAVPRKAYRLALPREGEYRLVINSNAEDYSGKDMVSISALHTEDISVNGREHSALIDLPPLTTLWFNSSPKNSR